MTQFRECIPIVTVSVIAETKAFFTEVLGFKIDFDAGDVVGLLNGNVMIYVISETSVNKRQPAGTANLNFLVDDVDDLYRRCLEAGTKVLVEPGDRDYGQRDFAIRDHDGNVFVFACGLDT